MAALPVALRSGCDAAERGGDRSGRKLASGAVVAGTRSVPRRDSLDANHVHSLVVPHISPTRFLQSLKSYTARQVNKLLGRTGEPFWQRESYDHWVRNETERRRIIAYIENNPVKAGLVNVPQK